MSDHDRGPYTPPSERLAFDPREPVRSGPPPVTLIASGLILLALIGGVAFIYRNGVRHPGPPAAVGQPLTQIKTPAPANAAPALTIDKTPADTNTVMLTPGPETPLPRSTGQPGAPPLVATAAPPPIVVASAAPPSVPVTHGPAKSIDAVVDSAVAPTAIKPPAKPKAAVATPPKPPKPAAVAAAPPAGAAWAQIGAFSSPALADKGWSDAHAVASSAMAGKGKKVEPVVAGGKTLYRAYVTGFASHDAAESFCAKLTAAHKPCIVK